MDDIQLYYEIHGEGSPLVLIAGFSCDHTFWSAILQPLTENHKVLLLDNRGIGQTESPDKPYSIEMMSDDVMRLVKKLGFHHPVIIGQSMGSAIAQDIAKRYANDINKIILINTFDQISKRAQIAFEAIAELHRLNVPIRYRVQCITPWVFSNDFLSQPHQLEKLIQLAEQNPYPQSLTGYERQLGALKKFDSRSWLHAIKIPALIIAAAEDILAPSSGAEEVQKKMGNNAKLTMIPGGHASPVEQPQKIIDEILKFVRS